MNNKRNKTRIRIQDIKNAVADYSLDRLNREKYSKQNVILGDHAIIDEKSIIGEYTYIGYYSKIGCATIGRYTSIGDFCIIGPGEHRIKNVSTSYMLYKDDIGIEYYDGDDECRSGGVTIGNDVWIGADSIIRRGVRIGDGAVIGAHSFVNRDVPDFAVVAGCPARIIKYRFSTKEIGMINDSHWWDEDIKKAKQIVHNLAKIINNQGE